MRNAYLLFAACLASGIAVPLPEDVPLLAAGAAAEPGHLVALLIAGSLGVFARDAVFYGIGRVAGESALRWKPVRWLIGDARIEKMRDLVQRRGGRAVLMARFFFGFRTAGFLAAGAAGVRVRDFVLWDGLGIAVSVPLMLGLGMIIGEPVMIALQWVLENQLLVVGLMAIVGLAWVTSQQARKAERAAKLEAEAA